MASSAPPVDHDPAVESLQDHDQRLGILCNHCSRFRYLNAGRYASGTRLSQISSGLTCSHCGSKDARAVAVSRDPKNGYWPAERS